MYEDKMLNLNEDMTSAVVTYSNLSNIANLGQKELISGFKGIRIHGLCISASAFCYEDPYMYTYVHWERGNYVVYFI